MNNPETYVLTYNRFNTYMILIFTDLKKAQIYKMRFRDSHHQEIEMVTKFDYQHLFKPFEKTNENFLFKIGDKGYLYVGEKIFTFKTIDDIEENFSKTKHSDVKYPFALGKENIYYMLHQKYISIENLKMMKWKTNINIYTKKTPN